MTLEAQEPNPVLRDRILDNLVPIDPAMPLRESMRRDGIRRTLSRFLGDDMSLESMLSSFREELRGKTWDRSLIRASRYLRDRAREQHLSGIEVKLEAGEEQRKGKTIPLTPIKVERLERNRDNLKRILQKV